MYTSDLVEEAERHFTNAQKREFNLAQRAEAIALSIAASLLVLARSRRSE